MTVGDYEGPTEIVPEFREIVNTYAAEFDLERDSQVVLDNMLRRGSAEVMSLPPGQERSELIADASLRLEGALTEVQQQFRNAGIVAVERDALEAVMQGVCPVPPFCLGGLTDPSQSRVSAGPFISSPKVPAGTPQVPA